MRLQRIVHTTLAHPMRPEFSFSALAVDVRLPLDPDIDRILEALKIEPISGGSISEFELKQVVAFLLCDDPEIFEFAPKVLLRYVNDIGVQSAFLDEVILEPHIAPASEDAEARALLDLVRQARAAEVGVFTVPETATSAAAAVGVLILVVSGGLIACGASRGILGALDHGLFDGVSAMLMGSGAA